MVLLCWLVDASAALLNCAVSLIVGLMITVDLVNSDFSENLYHLETGRERLIYAITNNAVLESIVLTFWSFEDPA